ncbi:50S ribosomal protein L31 [Pseudomonadota bacterium]
MASANIHPDYHNITVVMTNGKKFETKSCYGKEGDIIKLDVDIHNHPAWHKDKSQFVNLKNAQVDKFNKKYGGNFDI